MRWEREPLAGLSAPKAYLANIYLCKADLFQANLQEATLKEANLQKAFLINTKNLTPKQIKSACFWSEAIYKAEWNKEKKAWIAIEPDNTNFIEGLKKDKSSDPKKAVDCSGWENGDF